MSADVDGTTTGPRPPVIADPGPGAGAPHAPSTSSANAGFARLVEGFNRSRRPAEIVRAMLDDGVELLGGSTATLHVLSEAGDELVLAGSTGVPAEALTERFGRIPLSSGAARGRGDPHRRAGGRVVGRRPPRALPRPRQPALRPSIRPSSSFR